jgi:hypothetical protein
MVYRTLNLVACGYDINVQQLSDLLAVNIETPSFDRQNQPLDRYAPVEASTCLLTYNEDSEILNLAHYTVKEYLNSSRICDGPAKIFQMTDDSMHAMAASCFIIYMLYENYDFEPKPVMDYAIIHWYRAIQSIDSESIQQSLSTLIIQLVNPCEAHYPRWRDEVKEQSGDTTYPYWIAECGAERCTTLASICWFGFMETAKVFLETSQDPFPFHKTIRWSNITGSYRPDLNGQELSGNKIKNNLIWFFETVTGLEILTVVHVALVAAFALKRDFLDLMVSKGADINICSLTGFSLLNTVLHFRLSRFWQQGTIKDRHQQQCLLVDYLLAKGAQPDLSRCTIAPLQSVMEDLLSDVEASPRTLDFTYHISRKLLERGARVNDIADDEANIQRIRLNCQCFFPEFKNPSVLQREIEYTESVVQNRGTSSFYDTPLRMLRDGKKRIASLDLKDNARMTRLVRLERLLLSSGAKSLHLFPVKGLPGYVEEDIEEWKKLNARAVVTSPSPSTTRQLVNTPAENGVPFIRCTMP